ncbi:type IV secretion system protein [Massilia sp. CCM 9210]|uniref:type IV secretion system protein n=1 Tax=Massilia scottii TaxID=3057166 RepID=UPI002796DD5B|nr:type IV secretion system protein [Massilia sp. CCM 9210]MDQ1815802.1 type IV secretion system protein [Massilia sp. CCM 9210]
MKRILASVTLAALGLASNPAQAQGIPVYDNLGLLKQIASWTAQFQQMKSQYDQMKTQYEALRGTKGWGDLLINPALQGIVPKDMANIYRAVQAGGNLSGTAAAYRDAAKIYMCENRTGPDYSACRGLLNTNAQSQGYAADALALLDTRMTQIDSLRAAIKTMVEPKDIADLQARIQAENAQVANDTSRLIILKAMADAQAHAVEQTLKEHELKSLASDVNAGDDFVYKKTP